MPNNVRFIHIYKYYNFLIRVGFRTYDELSIWGKLKPVRKNKSTKTGGFMHFWRRWMWINSSFCISDDMRKSRFSAIFVWCTFKFRFENKIQSIDYASVRLKTTTNEDRLAVYDNQWPTITLNSSDFVCNFHLTLCILNSFRVFCFFQKCDFHHSPVRLRFHWRNFNHEQVEKKQQQTQTPNIMITVSPFTCEAKPVFWCTWPSNHMINSDTFIAIGIDQHQQRHES